MERFARILDVLHLGGTRRDKMTWAVENGNRWTGPTFTAVVDLYRARRKTSAPSSPTEEGQRVQSSR
jgi:hypothetical protein